MKYKIYKNKGNMNNNNNNKIKNVKKNNLTPYCQIINN